MLMREASGRDGGDDDDLTSTVAEHEVARGNLAVGTSAQDEVDDDDDALLAEKIRLLMEENARLRAVAGPDVDASPAESQEEQSLSAAAAGMADWLITAAKEREKAAQEVRAGAACTSRAGKLTRPRLPPPPPRPSAHRPSTARAARCWRKWTAG